MKKYNDIYEMFRCTDEERIELLKYSAELLRNDEPLPTHINIFLSYMLEGLSELYKDPRKPDKKTIPEILKPVFEWQLEITEPNSPKGRSTYLAHELFYERFTSKSSKVVADVADKFGVDPSTISKQFKQVRGVTVNQYLIYLRETFPEV